jgi:hypothetical protein
MAAQVNEVYSSMDSESKKQVDDVSKAVIVKASTMNVKDMAGITQPMGFWDPWKKSEEEGANVYTYREIELAHGRWAMMCTLGIAVTEGAGFHPFLGKDIPFTSAVASHWNPTGTFQYIDAFWLGLWAVMFVGELGNPWFADKDKPDIPGDRGWDPLGLRPKDAKGLLEMQNKELNNGRLAMFAAAGMIAQELVTGKPIFR